MRQVLKPSRMRFVLGPSHLHWSIVLMHQFPFIVGSCCTWHWQDLDWNQQAQGISWREAGKFWNQLELKQLSCKLQLLWSLHINIIFSFVLGPCCYSWWHWVHLERNRQAGWAA
jgi:hypothetical protein